MERLIALSVTFFLVLGCSSTTLIKSNPPSARLHIDGKFQGETPHFFSDKAVAGTMRTVTLKKEGYKEFAGVIRREKLSVPTLIGGIFLIVPFFWVLEYPPEYIFEMERL